MKFQLEIGTAYEDEAERATVKWRVVVNTEGGVFLSEAIDEELGKACDQALKLALYDRAEEGEELTKRLTET